MVSRCKSQMTSIMLGHSALKSITPSVNGPLVCELSSIFVISFALTKLNFHCYFLAKTLRKGIQFNFILICQRHEDKRDPSLKSPFYIFQLKSMFKMPYIFENKNIHVRGHNFEQYWVKYGPKVRANLPI